MTGINPTRVIGGRYVVLGELGHGGPGVVWRAQDRVMDRQVAVTELHLPAGQGPDERRLVRERLLRAARAARRIDHPGVVTVHDVVTDDDLDHIVTELVDAPTLADRMAAEGPRDVPAATALARQLSAALHAAHAAGVVHGDISPRTVVLGPDGRARLAGLGVAEAVDRLRATRDPEFLAPELRDGGPATPESDLWALGATLHAALLGAPPSGDLPPSGTAGALNEVLAGLLRPAPRERPTARHVVAALDAPAAPAAPAPGRGRRWGWAAAAAVLGLLIGLGGGFALAGGAPRVATFTYGAGGDVPLAGPVTGACLAAGPESGTGTVVGCADPHAAEVVATLDPYGERDLTHPGKDALDRFAAGACPAAFEAMVAPPDREGLALAALVPSVAAFDSGDRAVHCLLRAADGSALTGTRVAGERG